MKLGAFFLGVTLGECPCKEISEDLGYGRVEGKNLQRTIQGTMITRMKSYYRHRVDLFSSEVISQFRFSLCN